MDVADHVLLTFVPASFDDLLLLNPASVQSTMDSAEEHAGDEGVSIRYVTVTGLS